MTSSAHLMNPEDLETGLQAVPPGSTHSTSQQQEAIAPENIPTPLADSDDVPPWEGTAHNEEEIPEKEHWRCMCDKKGRDDSDTRPAVQCDTCAWWQHRGCFYLSVYEDDSSDAFVCHRCESYGVKGFIQEDEATFASWAADKEGKPWLHNMRKFEILKQLSLQNVEWLWTLYSRPTAENREAMKAGRTLKGRRTTVKDEYRMNAEKAMRELLDAMSEADVLSLHATVMAAGSNRSQLYNALLAYAEQLRTQSWEIDGEELDLLAKLFGWD